MPYDCSNIEIKTTDNKTYHYDVGNIEIYDGELIIHTPIEADNGLKYDMVMKFNLNHVIAYSWVNPA